MKHVICPRPKSTCKCIHNEVHEQNDKCNLPDEDNTCPKRCRNLNLEEKIQLCY